MATIKMTIIDQNITALQSNNKMCSPMVNTMDFTFSKSGSASGRGSSINSYLNMYKCAIVCTHVSLFGGLKSPDSRDVIH